MSSNSTSASSIDRTMWMASSLSSFSLSSINAKDACIDGWRWSRSSANDRNSAMISSKVASWPWRAQTSSIRSVALPAAVGNDIQVIVDDGICMLGAIPGRARSASRMLASTSAKVALFWPHQLSMQCGDSGRPKSFAFVKARHHMRVGTWLQTITHARSRVLGANAQTALVAGGRRGSFLGKQPLCIDGANRTSWCAVAHFCTLGH